MADGFSDLPPEQAAPAQAEPQAAATDPNVFILGTAISIPGKSGPQTEIPVRRPTAGDILQVGNPVIFDPVSDPPQITHHPGRMSQMIFRLTGVSPPVQATMDPQDIVGLFWHLTPFFIPRM